MLSRIEKLKNNKNLLKASAVTAVGAMALSACGGNTVEAKQPSDSHSETAATSTPSPTAEHTEKKEKPTKEEVDASYPSYLYANTLANPTESPSANKILHEATPKKARDNFNGWHDTIVGDIELSKGELATNESTALGIANNIDARVLAIMNAGRTSEDVQDCTDHYSNDCAVKLKEMYGVENMFGQIGINSSTSDLAKFYNAIETKYINREAKGYDCDDETDTCRAYSQVLKGEKASNYDMPDIDFNVDSAGVFNLTYSNALADNGMKNVKSNFLSNQTSLFSIVNVNGVINEQTREVTINGIDYETDVLIND